MHEQFDATSRYARPPPTDDGTPSESVEDVLCRVRQCLAKLEAAHSGADIVIIAPDLDVLTIMQAPNERNRRRRRRRASSSRLASSSSSRSTAVIFVV